MGWDTLCGWLETPIAFAIYTSPALVMVVPKRAFAVTDQPPLRSLLRERVQSRPLRGTQRRPARALILWVALIAAFLAIWQFLQPH